MDDPLLSFAKDANTPTLNWCEFLDRSLDPTHTLSRRQRCTALNLYPNTGITSTSLGFLKRMKELGLPGMVIGVSDYQREALMLCLELAFSTALRTRVRHSTLPQKLRFGDLIGFSDTVMEYRGTSEHPDLGTVLEYCPGRKMKLDRFPKLHRVRSGSTVNVLNKKRLSLSKQIKAYRDKPKSLNHIFDVCSYIPEAIGIGVPSTPLPNVAPRTLGSIEIEVKHKRYSLRELLPIARYMGDGDYHLDYAYKIDASPSVVSAKRDRDGNSDLFDFVDYLERGGKLSCVIVELSNPQGLNGYIGELRDLWEKHRVHTMIFCDAAVAAEIEHIDDLNYERFIWSKRLLSHHADLFPDFCLSGAQQALVNQSCAILPIEPKQEISNSAKGLEALWSAQQQMTLDEQASLSQLTRLHYQALRQTAPLPLDIHQQIVSQLDSIKRSLCGDLGGYSLTKEETSVVRAVCDEILISSTPSTLPNKAAAIAGRLENLGKNERLCLIVPNEDSRMTESRFWRGEASRLGLDPGHLRFCTPRQFLKEGPSANGEAVVVSGWFNRSQMDQILNSGNSELYYLLLYTGEALEVDWYKLAPNAWNRREVSASAWNRNCLEKLGVSLPECLILQSSPTPSPLSSQDDQGDPMENRERLGRVADQTRIIRLEGDERLARQVSFSNGDYCFLECAPAGGTRPCVVPDQSNLAYGCLRKNADSLEPGDAVLRIRSDADRIGDAELYSNQYAIAFSEARAWHVPIDAALRYMSRSRIVDRISNAGCSRNFATISRWIDDPDLIMPHSKKDVEYIGKALSMPFSEEDIRKMSEAASYCRGERITKGRDFVSDGTDRFMFHYLSLGSAQAALQECNKESEGRCTFELLRVDTVSDRIAVPRKKLGWVIRSNMEE